MEFVIENDGKVQIRVTEAELLIINNALNEIYHGIDISEFETRIGSSVEQAKALLKSIGSILDSLPNKPV